MSTRKAVPVRNAPILPVGGLPQADADENVRQQMLDDVEVKSLSVDEDFDLGGDPYNSTGQFVVLQASQKK